MVRIVSGQRSDPNEALLQGMQIGQGFRQAQMARQEAQAQQLNQALRMQEIQLRFQKARAEREEMLSRAAQMGDVRALQQMALEAQIPESDKMGRAALQTLSGITDPDAREEAIQAFKPLIETTRKREREQALETGLQDALKDGLIDEAGVESAKTRYASGEEPETLLGEIQRVRGERAASAANAKTNADSMGQARQMIDAAPPGPDKKRAEILFAEWEQSPSLQEKEGEGPQRLAMIQRELVKSREDQIARHVAQRKDVEFLTKLSEGMQGRKDQFGAQEFPTVIGQFGSGEAEQPRTPAMQTHIEKQRAEKEKRYPGSTARRQGKPAEQPKAAEDSLDQILSSSSSDEDLLAKLKASGIPKTPENQRRIQEFRRASGARQ